MIAFTSDVILVSLEGDVIQILIDDDRINKQFKEYSRVLTERVIKDTKDSLNFIEEKVEYEDLDKEGLLGSELNFKYAFLNDLISVANDAETFSPYQSEQPFSKLPTLDEYTETDIISWGETENPRRTTIRKYIVSWGDIGRGAKKAGGFVKKKLKTVLTVALSGSNKYLESAKIVIPHLGALTEIKNFLELGINAADSLKSKK